MVPALSCTPHRPQWKSLRTALLEHRIWYSEFQKVVRIQIDLDWYRLALGVVNPSMVEVGLSREISAVTFSVVAYAIRARIFLVGDRLHNDLLIV